VSRARKDSRLYRSPTELGLTIREWVTIGEEVGQWQMGGVLIKIVSVKLKQTRTIHDAKEYINFSFWINSKCTCAFLIFSGGRKFNFIVLPSKTEKGQRSANIKNGTYLPSNKCLFVTCMWEGDRAPLPSRLIDKGSKSLCTSSLRIASLCLINYHHRVTYSQPGLLTGLPKDCVVF
jgi:hypothetical protein